MMPTARPKNRTLGFLCCALAGSFWGCGFFFGKIVLAEMSVGAYVFYRFLFATIGLLPIVVMRRPRFSAKEWRILLLCSFLGVPLQFLLQYRGLSLTTVSHASLMVGTMPVFLALGAVIFAHERLPAAGWMALIGSTAGAGLIAFGGHHAGTANGPTLIGDVTTVCSLGIALFWILINKRLMETHDHLVVSAYGILLGTIMLGVWVPIAWGPPPLHGVSLKAWLALIGSGLLCSAVTTLLWNWGLTQVPASEAGILLNMEPLIGSVLGVFVLHEQLGGMAWVGGALILGSAVVLTTQGPASAMSENLLAES